MDPSGNFEVWFINGWFHINSVRKKEKKKEKEKIRLDLVLHVTETIIYLVILKAWQIFLFPI